MGSCLPYGRASSVVLNGPPKARRRTLARLAGDRSLGFISPAFGAVLLQDGTEPPVGLALLSGKGLSSASFVELQGKVIVMRTTFYGALMLAVLAACEGPNEQAGERQDEAAANQAGEAYGGSGPAERVGRAQDQADQAADDARRATKDAVAADSENYRRQVEVEARRLEEQARELRERAKVRGQELEAEAAEVANQ